MLPEYISGGFYNLKIFIVRNDLFVVFWFWKSATPFIINEFFTMLYFWYESFHRRGFKTLSQICIKGQPIFGAEALV